MPFIGNAGQFSNIHEKNYASSTLRVVEGDALYQAYNPADSHYKLITTLQEVTTIGSVTANTIQFTNPITSLVTSSNIGVANTQPMHTLDVGANVYIDDRGSNKIHTSGTTYSSIYKGETAVITDSVTVRDTIVDRIYPKTNGYVQFMSNVGVLNTAPIHTLDIGANVQIDEYGSNTFYTSGNVYSEHFKSSNITVSGTIDTDEVIINHVNAKSTDFVNFTSNVGILNTAPIHTLDIGANVQIDELGSNTFYTSGNVHAYKFTGEEITLAGTIVASDFILSGVGASATPTPQLQTVSEALPQSGQIAFSSDRTLTLSNTTSAMNATIINVTTTNSNLIGDNVTAVTTRSNLIADNVNSVTVTATTTNSNLIGDNVTAVTTNSNLVGDSVTVVTTNSNLVGDNVTVVTTNSNLVGDSVTVVTTNSNLVGDNVTVVTTNSNLIAGNVTVDNDLIVNTDDFVVDTVNSRVGINVASPSYTLEVGGDINIASGFHLKIGGVIPIYSRWTAGGGSDINRSSGNVGIGSSSPSQKLDVNGSIQHKGLVVTSGSNVDQITSFTKSLSFTDTAWKDTSISGTDLVTGSYMVQIYSNEQAGNMNYHEYYTGFMSWYDGSTNSTESSEIILHAAGEKPQSNHIYLRVLRQSGNASLKLQMRRDIATNANINYIFKFRRMM